MTHLSESGRTAVVLVRLGLQSLPQPAKRCDCILPPRMLCRWCLLPAGLGRDGTVIYGPAITPIFSSVVHSPRDT